MYDESIDVNNPMFDLNRDLIAEQKNISILSSGNYIGKIEELMKDKKTYNSTNAIQFRFF